LVKIIKENLSKNQINKNKIKNDLNDEEISKINLYYLDDKFDGDVKSKCKKVYCVFDEDNIIILLNDNILNISYIQSKNILIKIKKIILKKFQ